MMNGHKAEYFWLMLSFIGWWLLCILTIGILTFWVVPYVNVAKAEFYESIKGQKEQVVEVSEQQEQQAE